MGLGISLGVEACWGQDNAFAAVVGDCWSEIGVTHIRAYDDVGIVEGAEIRGDDLLAGGRETGDCHCCGRHDEDGNKKWNNCREGYGVEKSLEDNIWLLDILVCLPS